MRHSTRVSTLLTGFRSDEARTRAEEFLARCASRELAADASLTPTSLPNGAFILVEDGFVVVRTAGASGRRVVSCYGAAGTLLPPLARGETLSRSSARSSPSSRSPYAVSCSRCRRERKS
ncbi:MAG: hypothetical protein WKF65_02180 [Gaiellaceae bacterium]